MYTVFPIPDAVCSVACTTAPFMVHLYSVFQKLKLLVYSTYTYLHCRAVCCVIDYLWCTSALAIKIVHNKNVQCRTKEPQNIFSQAFQFLWAIWGNCNKMLQAPWDGKMPEMHHQYRPKGTSYVKKTNTILFQFPRKKMPHRNRMEKITVNNQRRQLIPLTNHHLLDTRKMETELRITFTPVNTGNCRISALCAIMRQKTRADALMSET